MDSTDETHDIPPAQPGEFWPQIKAAHKAIRARVAEVDTEVDHKALDRQVRKVAHALGIWPRQSRWRSHGKRRRA